jgi:hypothetical protein
VESRRNVRKRDVGQVQEKERWTRWEQDLYEREATLVRGHLTRNHPSSAVQIRQLLGSGRFSQMCQMRYRLVESPCASGPSIKVMVRHCISPHPGKFDDPKLAVMGVYGVRYARKRRNSPEAYGLCIHARAREKVRLPRTQGPHSSED